DALELVLDPRRGQALAERAGLASLELVGRELAQARREVLGGDRRGVTVPCRGYDRRRGSRRGWRGRRRRPDGFLLPAGREQQPEQGRDGTCCGFRGHAKAPLDDSGRL